MKKLQLFANVVLLVFFAAFSANAAPKVITWEDLIPLDNSAPTIDFGKFTKPKGMPSLSEFDGSQDALNGYVDDMEFMRQMQPQDGDALAMHLNGQEIRIAGYVTPLSFDGDRVVDFLFVPYHGACIHVPPPAANQIVYVENAQGLTLEALYDPVWLTGRIKTIPVSTLVANVGYSMSGAKIEPYTDTDW
ncbi:MAG: DUF3299 domain-containing protein [Pseudomonadota bacterium]